MKTIPGALEHSSLSSDDEVSSVDTEQREQAKQNLTEKDSKCQEICWRFVKQGRCASLDFEGRCYFKHVRDLGFQLPTIVASSCLTQMDKRCSMCTLPLPCCVHFPPYGQSICSSCQEIKQSLCRNDIGTKVKDDTLDITEGNETAGEAVLIVGEKVAVVPRHLKDVEDDKDLLLVYARVEEDKPAIERVVVSYLSNDRKREVVRVTIRRDTIYRLPTRRNAISHHLDEQNCHSSK